MLTIAMLTTPALAQEKALQDADWIAGQMRTQTGGGYSARLRMEMRPGAGKPVVMQILVKGERSDKTFSLLWQVMYPGKMKGAGVLVLRQQGKFIGGAAYLPGGPLEKFGAENLSGRIFGSDLSFEDLDQEFWKWEIQKDGGRTTLNNVACVTVESRRGSEKSIYQKIRSVIDLNKMVPLRIEKYAAAGKLVRLIETLHVVKLDSGRFVADKFLVSSPGEGTSTLIEVVDVKKASYPEAQFTAAALLELKMP